MNDNIELTIEEPSKQQDLFQRPIVSFQSAEISDLNSALAKAQGDFPTIVGESSIGHISSKYASIHSIIKAVQPSLKANGLSISHHATREDGGPVLITILRHSSGQWTTSRARISPEKDDFLAYSTYIGQLKRVGFLNLLNITTQD